jgi:hypothetical protein
MVVLMLRSELTKTLSPETQEVITRLLRDNGVIDDWTAIGFKRNGNEVLVSVGTSPSQPFLVFSVPADEWPQVEPWWKQGSVFPTDVLD